MLLFNNPIDLNSPRKTIGSLSALLSGHARLQEHQYKLGIADPDSPLCLCWGGDESAEHYLNECQLNSLARTKHNPMIGHWDNITAFIKDCWHQP